MAQEEIPVKLCVVQIVHVESTVQVDKDSIARRLPSQLLKLHTHHVGQPVHEMRMASFPGVGGQVCKCARGGQWMAVSDVPGILGDDQKWF